LPQRTMETCGTRPLRLGAFEFARVVLEDPRSFAEHLHENAHLVMVFSGSLTDISGGREVDITAGDLLFHPAKFVHASRTARPDTELVIMHVERDMIRAFCPLYGNVARSVHLPFETLRGVPDRIREELIHQDEAAPVILESLAMQLLALGSRTSGSESCMPPDWLPAVMTFIHQTLAAPLTVRSIAAHAGVSASRLAHVFKAVIGRSVTTYIRECRVRAAAAALRESAAPIGDVAVACGFYDQAHLSRAFKTLRNMTPLQYRRAHRPQLTAQN
jgi:AraC family transcriptional regulator